LALLRNSQGLEGIRETVVKEMRNLSHELGAAFTKHQYMAWKLARTDVSLLRPMDVLDKTKWEELSVAVIVHEPGSRRAEPWNSNVVLGWKRHILTIPVNQVHLHVVWTEQYDETLITVQGMQEAIASPPPRLRNACSTSRTKRKATCQVHILDRNHPADFVFCFVIHCDARGGNANEEDEGGQWQAEQAQEPTGGCVTARGVRELRNLSFGAPGKQ